MSDDIQAKPAPKLDLPAGETCTVSIIDTTCLLTVHDYMLVEPHIDGKDWLNLPDWAFHIKNNKTGEQLVFDLGTRKDWYNAVPSIVDLVGNHVPGISIEKDATEILEEGGVKLSDLKAMILSHWHFDHCGNLSKLPKSVDLIVGPGFKKSFLPGYPTNQESTFWESDFEGRNVIEAPFDSQLGGFDSWDYFGDGSVFILNTVGHAVGHVSALVRTTPDTFVFLGGDICHFTGDIRPSEYIPLPSTLPDDVPLDNRFSKPCPCSIFTALHPNQKESRTQPFYECATGPTSFYIDPPTAMKSIRKLIDWDAQQNVLSIIAHDPAPLAAMKLFPHHNINDWHEKGLKKAMHWQFLNEMPATGVKEKEVLVDGCYRDGKKVRGLAARTQ